MMKVALEKTTTAGTPRRGAPLCTLAMLAAALGMGAQAQTYSELKAAVAAAEDGATVHVTSDMTFDSAIEMGNSRAITIMGWDDVGKTGRVWRLTRALDYAEGAFFSVESGAHTQTLKNVVLDLQCEKRARCLTKRVIQVVGNSRFTLGSGAKICNVYQGGDYPGAMAALGGGTVVMEAGSEISDAYCFAYGSAVQVGRGQGHFGTFIMNGGLITDCHGPDTSGNTDAWGGAVHVYGGQFKFNGGLITGNVAPHHTGGVVLYRAGASESERGMMFCGGSGAITGNVGKVANDVYCLDNKSNVWVVNQTYNPDTTYYKGAVMTVKCGSGTSPAEGETCVAVTMQGSTSSSASLTNEVGNISLQDDPSLALDPASIGKGTSLYLTVWRRKLADVVANGAFCVRFSMRDIRATIKGKTAVVGFWQDCARDTTAPMDVDALTDVTFRSMGERKRFYVPENDNRAFMRLAQPGSLTKRVRFENIIIDGNSPNGAVCPGGDEPFILMQRGVTVELGAGATLCNVYCPSNRTGIVAVSKSYLTLEEGSVISNVVSGTWCGAITVGNDSNSGDYTVFNMSGGLITACESRGGGEPKYGNGGPVTIRHAQMNMSGGAITGNNATDNTSAGVLLHKAHGGVLNLSNDARICDNTGKFPDLFIGADAVHYSGDFRGLVGVCSSSLSLNVNQDAGATGAWCFYKSSNTPAQHKVSWGYVDAGAFAWGTPTGWIDGYGFVQASDVNVRLADAEDLSTPEALAKLPHVLSGSALSGTLSAAYAFDGYALLASGTLPLLLYTCSDGTFTGKIAPTLPTAGRYRFKIESRTVGGVSGLYLARYIPGMVIYLR